MHQKIKNSRARKRREKKKKFHDKVIMPIATNILAILIAGYVFNKLTKFNNA